MHTTTLEVETEKQTASILKIPASAWKWPVAWPFDADSLELATVTDEKKTSLQAEDLKIEIFARHIYETLIGGSIKSDLRIAAIIPDEIDAQKVEQIFLSQSKNNPTKLIVFPISEAVNNRTLDSLPIDYLDAAVFIGVIGGLTKPTEIFQQAWKSLKFTSGYSFACFTGTSASSSTNTAQATGVIKLWSKATDEQKIWISGSFHHYGREGGWESIEAFDASGLTGEKILVFEKTEKESALIVQAKKIASPAFEDIVFPESVIGSEESEEKRKSDKQVVLADWLQKRLLAVPFTQSLDIQLLSQRIANDAVNGKVVLQGQEAQIIRKLTEIYTIIKDISDGVIPKAPKAALAATILKQWENSEAQITALKMATSIIAPDEEFWRPVGTLTAKLAPIKKIFFLADIIKAIGNSDTEGRLKAIPLLLKTFTEAIKTKLELTEDDAAVQTFAANLVLSDFVLRDKAKRKSDPEDVDRILRYIQSLTKEQLEELLGTN